MLVALWIAFLLVMLFVLGSTVGSFLNVCIVRLPEGRSLIRPGSCCGNCHQPIAMRDNLPLLSYCLLRGRCRMCGASFSMRYFWIELLTGLVFVALYHLEIGRNIHHFDLWFGSGYEYLESGRFPPHSWQILAAHAFLACFLIVAMMCNEERHRVPRSVTGWGTVAGLSVALLFPWPWPDTPAQAIAANPDSGRALWRVSQPYAWGPYVGAMPAEEPWWLGDVTPHAGLYPWPVWGPLPDWLPPGSRQLGLATGLVGVAAGAFLMGAVQLLFNWGTRTSSLGWGETSLLMIAGAFLGWQPVVFAGVLALFPGLLSATMQWAVGRRSEVSFTVWLTLAVAGVWLGWYWLGPLVQGLFFNPFRLLWSAIACAGALLGFAVGLRLWTLLDARGVPSMSRGGPAHQGSRESP